MPYSALSLPKLETEGPDLIGAFAKGRALRDMSMRSALEMKREEREAAREERAAEEFEYQKSRRPVEESWREEERAHTRKTWDMTDKIQQLEYAAKASKAVKEALMDVENVDQYNQVREAIKAKGLPVDQLPETFADDAQLKSFLEKATKTLDMREKEFAAKLSEQAAEKQRTFQAGESEKSRKFQASESEKQRQHTRDTGQLYETSEGLLPRDKAIGKAKWRDPRDVKLTEEDKFKIGNLKKEAEGLVKVVQDFQMGKRDDMGKPITPEQRNKAVIRLKGIQDEVRAIVDAARPVNAPATTAAAPATALTPQAAPAPPAPATAAPQPGTAEAATPPPAASSPAPSWRDYRPQPAATTGPAASAAPLPPVSPVEIVGSIQGVQIGIQDGRYKVLDNEQWREPTAGEKKAIAEAQGPKGVDIPISMGEGADVRSALTPQGYENPERGGGGQELARDVVAWATEGSPDMTTRMPNPRNLPFDYMTIGGQFMVRKPGEAKFRKPTKEELALLKGK